MRSRAGHPETGTTLIELVIAVAIMGVAFVAILGGIGTAIIGADVQRRDATAGVVVTSAAEKLAAPSVSYVPCAVPGDYQGELPPPSPSPPPSPPRFTVSIDAVLFWEPVSNRFVSLSPPLPPGPPPDPPPDPPACVPDEDQGLQLIRLSITTTSGATAPRVELLEVVKQRPVT